jgi:Ca2+-binding RTX toxin-like protein
VRRTGLVFVVMAVALVVGSGAALAATIHCDGGVCEGTRDPDTLKGSAARDVMYGKGAGDKFYADGGDDEMYGGSGQDILRGGNGADEMHGGPHSDDFYGGYGADYFDGGSGRDRMTGGPGRDHLYGKLDDDTIASQDGVFDVVDCGSGNYDAVVIDRELDSVSNCENIYWQESALRRLF